VKRTTTVREGTVQLSVCLVPSAASPQKQWFGEPFGLMCDSVTIEGMSRFMVCSIRHQ